MRMIDADKGLISKIQLKTGCNFITAQEIVDSVPTVEERKQGQWEQDTLFGECAYVCSFCHTVWTSSEIENMHYCPTCGAEMRGTENE